MKWLTTAPNPRTPATGHDAGQRGWKLHAVDTDSDSFKEIRYARSLCGLQPRHGWSLDMFIEDRCTRCEKKVKEREHGKVPDARRAREPA